MGWCLARHIEYALNGGRINTDALDNSAGVDCSDHEVNIKILLNAIVANGDMTQKQRNLLLVEMTNTVSKLVLKNKELQSHATKKLDTVTKAHFMLGRELKLYWLKN